MDSTNALLILVHDYNLFDLFFVVSLSVVFLLLTREAVLKNSQSSTTPKS